MAMNGSRSGIRIIRNIKDDENCLRSGTKLPFRIGRCVENRRPNASYATGGFASTPFTIGIVLKTPTARSAHPAAFR